ncbi:hypothetical protein [Rurimicrobium arvi]|uniref:Lipoprotein n=1 Tax=Rurimicrobium arvi TaxID=2049916 RepID=A0ABP8MEY1_9BACT
MKVSTLALLPALLFCSCGSAPRDPDATYFSGDFAGSPLLLSIKQLDDSTVKGESDHKGQHLEMSGKRHSSERGYVYTMREIGQGRFSGVYEFEWDTTANMIFGSWVSIDSSSRTGVMYTLKPDSGK